MEVSERKCSTCGVNKHHTEFNKTQHGWHAPDGTIRMVACRPCDRASRRSRVRDIRMPDGSVRTVLAGNQKPLLLRGGVEVRRYKIGETASEPRPVRELSEIDAHNKAIRAAQRAILADKYRELDQEWERLKQEDAAATASVRYQIYGWEHSYRPGEIKVGICAIAANRYGGTRTDDRHFNPVEHFCLEVGTEEQALAVERAFGERYSHLRLKHVRTGNDSEFFEMNGRHAENAVKKIIRELT